MSYIDLERTQVTDDEKCLNPGQEHWGAGEDEGGRGKTKEDERRRRRTSENEATIRVAKQLENQQRPEQYQTRHCVDDFHFRLCFLLWYFQIFIITWASQLRDPSHSSESR